MPDRLNNINENKTGWIRRPEVGFLLSILLLVGVGYITLKSIENRLHGVIAEELTLSLDGSVELLRLWVNKQKTIGTLMVHDHLTRKNLLSLIQKTAGARNSKEDLMALEEVAWLRANLGPRCLEAGYVGFVVFNKSGQQVGAFLENAVGERQLMKESDFFQRSMKGEIVFSQPFFSEIPLPDITGIMHRRYPTMFMSFPVKSDRGEILGVVGFRLRPEADFSGIFLKSRTRKTGETYAFGKNGRMLSESRFPDHLMQIGLIPKGPDSQSILTVEIRDPGGDMTQGFRPATKPDQWPLTKMAESATQGNSGVDVEGYNDYRGVPVVGAWTWLPEYGFGITKEIDAREAYQTVLMLEEIFKSLMIGLILFYGGFLYFFLKKKRLEKNLLISENYYRAIINQSADPIIIINGKGIVQVFNPAAEKVFGYALDEVLGNNINMLMPEPDKGKHDSYLDRYLTTGQAKIIGFGREVTGLRKDGSTVPLELGVSEIHLENERKFCGILRDITARKKSEADLLASKRETELVLDSVDEGICGLDIGGKVRFVNPSALEILGFTQEEMMGKNLEALVHPPGQMSEEHGKNLFPFDALIKEGKIIEAEQNFFFTKKGEAIPVEFSLNPILADQKVAGSVISFRDITERNKKEALLVKTKEEAEEASRAKSEFLSRMSHELRTPMNAILGFAQLMKNNPTEKLTVDQVENVDEICKAGERLLFLINEVLDLADVEAGEITLSMEAVNLMDLAQEVSEMMIPVALQHSIEIVNEVFLKEPVFVYADRIRLKQVLVNLISNAIKYNDENGKVWIQCERPENNSIKISIRDSGVGISDDMKSRLFKPFDRAESDQMGVEGTGIGLTLSKRLVEMMEGKIHVESELGEGSRFSVELQVTEPKDVDWEKNRKKQERFSVEGNAQFTVLCVEDNPANRRLIKKVFPPESGFQLLMAHEARIGIELARAHIPDMILMDINLPGMDGITALRELRMHRATKDIPVIAISANAHEKDVDRAMVAGFKHYLKKPVEIEKLMEIVKMEFNEKNGV